MAENLDGVQFELIYSIQDVLDDGYAWLISLMEDMFDLYQNGFGLMANGFQNFAVQVGDHVDANHESSRANVDAKAEGIQTYMAAQHHTTREIIGEKVDALSDYLSAPGQSSGSLYDDIELLFNTYITTGLLNVSNRLGGAISNVYTALVNGLDQVREELNMTESLILGAVHEVLEATGLGVEWLESIFTTWIQPFLGPSFILLEWIIAKTEWLDMIQLGDMADLVKGYEAVINQLKQVR